MTALIYLYVLLDRGASTQMWRTQHPTYASCFAALDHLKAIPGKDTDEVIVAWCGTDSERHYGDTWWKDHAKPAD